MFTWCLCLATISNSQEKLICFYIWKYSNKIHTIKSAKRPGSKFIDGEITAAAFHLRYIFTTDIPLLPRELLFSRYSSDCLLLRFKFHNKETWSTVKIYYFRHFVRWSKGKATFNIYQGGKRILLVFVKKNVNFPLDSRS